MRGATLALLGTFALAAACSVYGSDDPPDTTPVGDAGTDGATSTRDDGSTPNEEGGIANPADAGSDATTPLGAPTLVQSQSASTNAGGSTLDIVFTKLPTKGNTLLVVATGFGGDVDSVSTLGQTLARIAHSSQNFELSLWSGLLAGDTTKINVKYKMSVGGPAAIAMEWANLGNFVSGAGISGIDSPTTAGLSPNIVNALVLGMAAAQAALGSPQGGTIVGNVSGGSPSLSVAFALIADPSKPTKFAWSSQSGAWDSVIATWSPK